MPEGISPALPLRGARYSEVFPVTLSVPAEAVDDNDVLADTQLVSASAFAKAGGTAKLEHVSVLDKDDQGVEMDLFFLNADVALGTEDAGISITDTNAEAIVAIVNVPAASYVDLIGCQRAEVANIGKVLKAAAGSKSLWIAAATRGTPTHTASGLIVRLGLEY